MNFFLSSTIIQILNLLIQLHFYFNYNNYLTFLYLDVFLKQYLIVVKYTFMDQLRNSIIIQVRVSVGKCICILYSISTRCGDIIHFYTEAIGPLSLEIKMTNISSSLQNLLIMGVHFSSHCCINTKTQRLKTTTILLLFMSWWLTAVSCSDQMAGAGWHRLTSLTCLVTGELVVQREELSSTPCDLSFPRKLVWLSAQDRMRANLTGQSKLHGQRWS